MAPGCLLGAGGRGETNGLRGTVVEALGKIWLLTIETEGWGPALRGERLGEIGPLAVKARERYSVLFMETIMTPGMTSTIHTHSGPGAGYSMGGETCLEIHPGKLVGRPRGKPVILPAGLPMLLVATGTEQRRGLTLILHESEKPPTTVRHEWSPKGLCKASP